MQSRLPINSADLGSYNDLNQLQKLKTPSKQDELDTIRKVAAQFESLFVNLIMKTMRQANQVLGDDSPLSSQQTRFYQGMYDQELAQKLSGQGGMGLQDVLVRQLSPGQAAETGSVDARQSALQQKLNDRRLSFSERRPQFESLSSARTAENSAASRLDRTSEGGDRLRPLVAGLPQSSFERLLGGQHTEQQSGHKGAVSQLVDAVMGTRGAGNKASISGPAQFVNQLLPYARTAAQRIGVPPQYLLAQAALETGWGKHLIGGSGENTSHNLFGIKAHRSWRGDTRTVTTHEYRQGVAIRQKASFRAYNDWGESFNDYVNFLQQNPRYKKALASTEKPEQFLNELQRAGYATDPRYAEKIQRIAHSPEMQAALQRSL